LRRTSSGRARDSRSGWPRVLGLLLLTSPCWLGSPAWAVESSDKPVLEHSLKAAFLYKFLAYIDWPAQAFSEPASPIVVGVMGADNLADELAEVVQARPVNGRKVIVRKLPDGDVPAGLHLLFIHRGPRTRVAAAIAEAHSRPVVTVTELPDGLALGSVINFVLVEGKVRFEISVDAAESAGLKVSSRLLAVAHRVQGGRS
jgi:hypothetical protein